MEEAPEVGLGFVRCRIEDEGGEGSLSLAASHLDRRWLQLFTNGFGNHSGAMFRRQAVQELGGYDPEFNDAEDYDLWCRLVAAGWDCRYWDEVLVDRRSHAGSLTATRAAGLDRAAARVSHRELARLLPGITAGEAGELRRLYLRPRELEAGSPFALMAWAHRLLRVLDRQGWGDPGWRRRIAGELLTRIRIAARRPAVGSGWRWATAATAARVLQRWYRLRQGGEGGAG